MQSPATSIGVSLRNLLFPTDFSPYSETTLAYGIGLARRYKATLYMVTVVPQEITDYVQPPDPFYLRHSAEKKMASLANLDALQGIRHREFVKEGSVSETVSELIDRLDIDLVVLGTHGRAGMKKLVLGSVAEEIVGSVACPVFTVGPRVPQLASPQPKLQSILYVASLPHASPGALRYAAWLAEQERAHLTLLNVLKMPGDVHSGYPHAEVEMAKTRLAQLLSPEVASSLEMEFIVEVGAPGQQILKVAERQGADLIAMDTHHTSFARAVAHLPWITPHEVICHARCPVLTVNDHALNALR